MEQLCRPHSRDGFEIAIICVLPVERNALEALLDAEYETDGFSYGKADGDTNTYTTGRLGKHHVVLVYAEIGTNGAAAAAAYLQSSFTRIKIGIITGICGGVPKPSDGAEIVLGDVIISTSVIQIDFGRQYPNEMVRKKEVEDTLGRANREIRAFTQKIRGHLVGKRLPKKINGFYTQICTTEGLSESVYPGPAGDVLYPVEYYHKHRSQPCDICDTCISQDNMVCELSQKSSCEDVGCESSRAVTRNRIQRAMGISSNGGHLTATDINKAQKPSIHFGRIACSNQVMRSGQHRDRIAAEENVIGFEMESAGTWDVIPTIVIKCVSDYADSHKTKDMQPYAAAISAACTKAVLEEWRPVEYIVATSRGIDLVNLWPPRTVYNGPVNYYVTTDASSSFQEIIDRSKRAIQRSNEEIQKSKEQRKIRLQQVSNLNTNVANSLKTFMAVLAVFTMQPIIAAFALLMHVVSDARSELSQIIGETDHSLQTLDDLQEENEDVMEAVVSEAERVGAIEAGLEQGASEGYHYPGDEVLVAEHSSTAQIIEEDRDSAHESERVTQNDIDPEQAFSRPERDSGSSQDVLQSQIDMLVSQEEKLAECINEVEQERIAVILDQESQKRRHLEMEQEEEKLKLEERRRRGGLFGWCTIL